MQETVEREVPRDRPPVDFTQAPHNFIESEFPEGKGRCDMCGGGPDAEIHQIKPDALERIATALESAVSHSITSLHWHKDQAGYELTRRQRGLLRRIVDWFLGER